MTAPAQNLDNKALRQFGLIMAGMIVLFFGLLIPWIWDFASPLWAWLVAAGFALVALLYPAILGPVYRGWMKVGAVLGWINTRLILGIVFFLIFVPFGLLMRLFNDPMRRRLHEPVDSYRVKSQQPKVGNLEKPF